MGSLFYSINLSALMPISSVLIIRIALQLILKSGNVMPPALFFLLQISVAI